VIKKFPIILWSFLISSFLKDINRNQEDFSDETDEDNALFRPPVKSKESLDETSESLKSLDLNSELLAQLLNSFETQKNVAQQSFQKIQKVIDNLDNLDNLDR